VSDGEVKPLHASPKALSFVVGFFTLTLGVPVLLFLLQGRWDLALGLLGVFGLMVGVTAYAFRKAVDARREQQEGEEDPPAEPRSP
jgi:membrane protein implicated in regulation of membrane protease activity